MDSPQDVEEKDKVCWLEVDDIPELQRAVMKRIGRSNYRKLLANALQDPK